MNGAPSEQSGHLWDQDHEQQFLFEDEQYRPHDWRREWQGMPEYRHDDLAPWATFPLHFRSDTDLRAFIELIGETRWSGKAFWYPPDPIGRTANKAYVAE